MQATVKLEYADAKMAAAVAEAVSPDNATAPSGLKVATQREGVCVVTDIIWQGKIATLIATLDDLLENATTAEKALHVMKTKRQ